MSPNASGDIVGSQLVTPVMLFFSIASIHLYCNRKRELASQVSAQPLAAEQPVLLLSCWKCYCLISTSET